MRKALREEKKGKQEKIYKIKTKFSKDNMKLTNIFNKKNTCTYIGIVVVLLIIIACLNYTSLGLVINKDITTKDINQIELNNSNNTIIPFGDEILVYNKGRVVCFNRYGKNMWDITIEDTINADIATSGEYIQIINKDKNIVYIYKNKYETARIKVEGNIYSGSINKKGISIVEYSSNGNKTSLGIYDANGTMKYNVKLGNGIIGKYILSDNCRYLAYTDVNVSGISAYTNVNLIDLKNINENNSNSYVIYEFNNTLAYDMYWSGKKLIIRTDNDFVMYNLASNQIQTYLIAKNTVLNVDQYKEKCAYIQIDAEGTYSLNIKKIKSDKIKNVTIDETPKYFMYENGVTYVCYQNKILAFNNLGMNIKEYTSDMVITKPVIFNDGKSVAMIISNKLLLFTI